MREDEMKKPFLLALALAPLAMFAATAAEARPARCVVTNSDVGNWRGPCDFTAERNGSFNIRPLRGGRFPGGYSDISVSMMGGGVADVRGLTRHGINSRWGDATRSRRDRACWVGDGFMICAY